jgi:hypothetical protein
LFEWKKLFSGDEYWSISYQENVKWSRSLDYFLTNMCGGNKL